MRKLILTLAIAFIGLFASAQEFMGIKPDGNKDIAVAAFEAKGFVLDREINNGVILKGKAGIDNVELYIIYTPKTKLVWKFTIFFPEKKDWYYLKENYNNYLSNLTEKYGKPELIYDIFKSPYKDGDGSEMTAVSAGACLFSAFWTSKGISLTISKYAQVQISYENEINLEINKNEKKSITLDIL